MNVWLLSEMFEQDLRDCLAAHSSKDGLIALPEAERLLDGLRRMEPRLESGIGVLLAPIDLRLTLRQLLADDYPDLAVLAFDELSPDMNVTQIGKLPSPWQPLSDERSHRPGQPDPDPRTAIPQSRDDSHPPA